MVGKDVNPEHTLAYTLRETLGYTGTKIACNHGGCGACTVLMDGEAVLIPQRWIVYMLVLNKLVTEYDG